MPRERRGGDRVEGDEQIHLDPAIAERVGDSDRFVGAERKPDQHQRIVRPRPPVSLHESGLNFRRLVGPENLRLDSFMSQFIR